MKILLDEMFPAAIAEALRRRGFDAIAVQAAPGLRELTDVDLFAATQDLKRAIVTENVVDFLPLDAAAHADGDPHWGIILTTNRSFPRHHDRFVSAMTHALAAHLEKHPEEVAASALYWLGPG